MALPYTPTTLSTLNNNSILAQSNVNFNDLNTACEDGLSRSGNGPNQMESNLDMNSNQILNLPPPAYLTSPLRVQDVQADATQINSIFGTNNTWTGTNTYTNTVTTNGTLNVGGTVTGNKTGTGNVVLATSPSITGTVGGSATYTTPTITSPTVTGAFTATGLVTNADLVTVANQTIKSNISGGTASPSDNSLSSVLDNVISSTQGTILYRGASNWTNLAPGTAGQLLSTNGAGANPSWLTPGMVLLNTFTANNSATVSDTTSFTSAFSRYIVTFDNVLNTVNAASINFRLRIISGGVTQTTTYLSGVLFMNMSSGVVAGSAFTTFIPVTMTAMPSTGMGNCGYFTLHNPSQTTTFKSIEGWITEPGQDAIPRGGSFFGWWAGGNGAVTGIEFSASANNLASGTFKVYGVA